MKKQPTWSEIAAELKTKASGVIGGNAAVGCMPAAEALYNLGGKDILSDGFKTEVRKGIAALADAGLKQAGDGAAAALAAEAMKHTACEGAKAGGKAALKVGGKAAIKEGSKTLAKATAKNAAKAGSKAVVKAGAKNSVEQAAKAAVKASTKSGAQSAAKLAVKQGGKTAVKAGTKIAVTEGAKSAVQQGGAAAAKTLGCEILKKAGGAAGMGAVLDGAFASAEALHGVCTGNMTKTEAAKHVAFEATTGAAATSAGVGIAAVTVALTGGIAAPAVFIIGAGSTLAAKFGLKKLFKK